MKGKGSHRGVGGIASRRREVVHLKSGKKRSNSSKQWLKRQLNDPYVAAAKAEGYRARAAFKLIELDEQFHLLKPGMRVVDLGAAPGSWSQVVLQKVGRKGLLIAIDILPMTPIPGAMILHMDFMDNTAPDKLKALLNGPADLVLSDMAPSTTGHTRTDHLRIMALAEAAAQFAIETLTPGGAFVCKLFQGGAQKELFDLLKQHFTKVKHAKPTASRAESAETYLVALGFTK